jgi:demethylmenaquinone methyltransferase / 2-methoxy-6-polyprenyl-1,4-benzoquinol methylase
MVLKEKGWSDENTRRAQLDKPVIEKQAACFGFEAIAEDEKSGKVLTHFNSVAEKYDIMNTILSFGTHYIWKHIAIKMLGLKPGQKVLDVCGGTGDMSVMAAKVVGPAGRVTLFDINREMMTTGRAKSTNAHFRQKVAYVQGNAEKIALADNSFDAAMVSFGIRNVTHMQAGFMEMHRVLKPGGRFLCLEFSKPVTPWFCRLYDFYSFQIMPIIGQLLAGSRKAYTYLPESIRMFPLPPELADILTEIGFRDVEYRYLTNGIAVAHVGTKK